MTRQKVRPSYDFELSEFFHLNLGGVTPSVPGINDYVVPYAKCATAGTTLTLTSSRTYWIPFGISRPITVNKIAINVTTASAGNHIIGIYNSNSSFQPYTRLVQVTLSASSTGVKSADVSQFLLSGVYWFGWASGSGATVRAIAIAGTSAFSLANLGTAFTTHWYSSGSTLPGEAPSSGYTVGTGSVPAIGILFSVS